MPYLVYVSNVHIYIGGTEDPYSESTVYSPEGFGCSFSIHVGRGCGDAPGVGGHGEGVQGQLGVQALLCHQHQVGHAAKHDTAPYVLQGNTTKMLCLFKAYTLGNVNLELLRNIENGKHTERAYHVLHAHPGQ